MVGDHSFRQARHEMRSMQEDVEAAVAEDAAADLTFADVLVDYGKQGLELRVEAGGRNLVGRVEHVGGSIFRVVTRQGLRVDVKTDAVIGVRVTSVDGHAGSVTTGHPRSLIARLREAVQSGERVHLERSQGAAVEGVVSAVLDDAVEVRSGSEAWIVPLAAVVWLWSL